MAETRLDVLNKVSAKKVALLTRVLRQQMEDMRDAITADAVTVNAAITATEAEADKAAIVAALATVKTDATALAATRVAAINTELAKLKDALS